MTIVLTCVFALVQALVDDSDVEVRLYLGLASDVVGEVYHLLVAGDQAAGQAVARVASRIRIFA